MKDVREHALTFSEAAIARLGHLVDHAASEQVQLGAAREILDRAHGKPRGETAGTASAGTTYAELVTASYDGEQQ
jgi:hypothetical protein